MAAMSATLSPSDFLASRTIVPGVSRVVSLSDIRTTTDTWEERRFEMRRGVSYGCKIVYTPHRDILQVGFTDRSAHVRTSSRNDTSRDRLRRTGTERLCDRQPHAIRWMDWQRERARGACHAQVSLDDTARTRRTTLPARDEPFGESTESTEEIVAEWRRRGSCVLCGFPRTATAVDSRCRKLDRFGPD